jgi:hypothetical protein
MAAENKCEFCNKRGLPLLLVRDAVARADLDAPIAPTLQIQLPKTTAHYTKRLLRSGYVNVFDEARNRWETYFVTSDSYFIKVPQVARMQSVVPVKPFNCPDEGHRAVASCITVHDPSNATIVWVGFSDVMWTDAVRDANRDRGYRERHMVEVDVKSALKGSTGQHRAIGTLASVVAEYSMEPNRAKQAFYASPFAFQFRRESSARLIKEFETLRPGKGLVVTLPDPAGILQEIALLMRCELELFINSDPTEKQRLIASAAIDQLKDAVQEQAKKLEIDAAAALAEQQRLANPIGHAFSDSISSRTDGLGNVTKKDLDKAALSAWAKYEAKFDDKARLTWYSSYLARLEKHETQSITPLALAHAAWMRSEAFSGYLACNFDPADGASGRVYAKVVTRCIAATQENAVCAKVYEDWLAGDVTDIRNVVLRAMVFNQSVIADAVKQASAGGYGLAQVPWDNVFSIYTTGVKALGSGGDDFLPQLVVALARPVMKMLDKVLDGTTQFRNAVIALGLIAGHPIITCEVVGSRKEFRAQLAKQLVKAGGKPVNAKELRRCIERELKRLRVEGAPLDGSTKHRWMILADKGLIADLPANVNPTERARRLAASVRTIHDLDNLNLDRWRLVIGQDVRFGIVTALLQAASWAKLIQDGSKTLSNERLDADWRGHAGLAALTSTTTEVLGTVLAKRAELSTPLAAGLMPTHAAYMTKLGRVGGIGAGIVMALLDFRKAHVETQEGASGVVVGTYVASGVLGLALSFALAASAALPIVGLLVALVIGIGMLLEHLKDNPIQDWLERCPWGKLKEQRYADLITMEAQLSLATK